MAQKQVPPPVALGITASGAGQPELVVIAKRDAGVRASAAGVSASAGEATSLQARLAARGP